jgi:uncharacterized protein
MSEKSLKIAIVGSGVAGLTAAYILNRKHSITLYEKNDYIGGHTHTVVASHDPDRNVPVDTGFIVMNHRTYPLLTKLFEQLGVPLRDGNMSFGYNCELSGIQYSSAGITSFFNRIKHIFNPAYYRIFSDMLKFYRIGKTDLQKDALKDRTLGQYLHDNGFSKDFIDHNIIPMGSAVWSTPTDTMLDFPAATFIRFLNNHGLMSLTEAPQWRTVVGGSHEYVKKILASLSGTVFTNKPVKAVKRNDKGVVITTEDGSASEYDKVIIAAHADEAFKILADPSVEEKRLLEPWRYNYNRTILHTDESVMPQNKRVWASWNFTREKTGTGSSLCLTYHMNRLQGLEKNHQYFVTLNSSKKLDRGKIILEMDYYHPQFTKESTATQKELSSLNGVRNTYFCGSYFGYGFHEDAVRSAIDVVKLFGMQL